MPSYRQSTINLAVVASCLAVWGVHWKVIAGCRSGRTTKRLSLYDCRRQNLEKFSTFEVLILGRHFDVIDDKDFHGALGRFEPQPDLLLEGGENGGAVLGRGRGTVGAAVRGVRAGLGRPFESNVVSALDAGFIDHGTAQFSGQFLGEGLGKFGKGEAFAGELAIVGRGTGIAWRIPCLLKETWRASLSGAGRG